MEFKAYHKIRQFKDIVRDIQFKANFIGLDDNGDPLYQEREKPVITFIGTVKLHGTNAQVCYDGKEIIAGKRSSLISKDALTAHFGFNQFVQVSYREYFKQLFEYLYPKYCKKGQQLILYGEWAGKGIQKNVGVSEFDKHLYVFDAKVYDPITDKNEWFDCSQAMRDFVENPWIEVSAPVSHIKSYETFKIDIDFNKPALFQNDLVKITETVENECPVSRYKGKFKKIGEGVVWTGFWKDNKYIFKVKGEKHSVTKVKKLASVDPEVLNSIYEFVDFACTENRMEQAIQETGATEKRHIPDLTRWIANDIISEETDTLISNGLEWKQVAKEVSNRMRQYYLTKLDKI